MFGITYTLFNLSIGIFLLTVCFSERFAFIVLTNLCQGFSVSILSKIQVYFFF
jgi:hypothetical protein